MRITLERVQDGVCIIVRRNTKGNVPSVDAHQQHGNNELFLNTSSCSNQSYGKLYGLCRLL
ncbi:hypothetical protein EXN66_Car005296 [Channa argus]|uniref:Uncharacterized protein n=1 Tax=Channa argus TaxID=215402 RepID=A0A6G1PHK4_CHAAH|nr:hypothetical protein EXN66_Car005296 [Channa argus]